MTTTIRVRDVELPDPEYVMQVTVFPTGVKASREAALVSTFYGYIVEHWNFTVLLLGMWEKEERHRGERRKKCGGKQWQIIFKK